MSSYFDRRNQQFDADWLAWTALRHFLPVAGLRCLAATIAERVSSGTVRFDTLFEDALASDSGWSGTWFLRPRDVGSPLERHLQSFLRALAWQNDVAPPAPLDLPPHEVSRFSELHQALVLGSADLHSFNNKSFELHQSRQKGVLALARVIVVLRERQSEASDGQLEAVNAALTDIDALLAVAILKHAGDLSADVDAWSDAATLYDEAEKQLRRHPEFGTNPLNSDLAALLAQSRGAATWVLKGGQAAAECFRSAPLEIRTGALFSANASHDEFVASFEGPPAEWPNDLRATVASPPLLLQTHSPFSAVQTWLTGNPMEAANRFWAMLRRQTALGSTTQARDTKAIYARALLDLLKKRPRQPDMHTFRIAARLLVESGNVEHTRRADWDAILLDAYVNEEQIRDAVNRAEAHEGVKHSRRQVVIALFERWIDGIPADRSELAGQMLAYIATLAREAEFSGLSTQNIAGHAFEVLHGLASRRPELRAEVRDIVWLAAVDVLERIDSWRGIESALSIAEVYADVFSAEQLKKLIDILLARPPTWLSDWHTARRVFGFLLSESSLILLRQDEDAARRVITTILAIPDAGGNTSDVLFFLQSFNADLLTDPKVIEKLREPINVLKDKASQINSSNTVEVIQSILIAPAVSGCDAVLAALRGLAKIIETASTERPSIVLAYAYQPLLLLARRRERFLEVFSAAIGSFQVEINGLIDRVIDFWKHVDHRPVLLTQFSIPPATVPDRVTVHNWAYASITFAEAFEAGTKMMTALSLVERKPELVEPIMQAIATRSGGQGSVSISPRDIRAESRNVFYALLGRRLAVLAALDESSARSPCAALAGQCLLWGPRESDVAVFLLSARLGIARTDLDKAGHWSNYTKRVRSKRELAPFMAPLLESWETPAAPP
jgi:hypothetical protein